MDDMYRMYIAGHSAKSIAATYGISHRATIRQLKLYFGDKEFKSLRYRNHSKNMSQKLKRTPELYAKELLDKPLKALEDYAGLNVKILHQCTVCSNIWAVSPNNILHSRSGCPPCSKSLSSSKRSKDGKLFYSQSKVRNAYVEVIGEYISESCKVDVRCRQCNYIWMKRPGDILAGSGCPKCQQGCFGTRTEFSGVTFHSIFESECARYLINLLGQDDVEFHRKYKGTNYVCDFYIKSADLWIEVSTINTQKYIEHIYYKRKLVDNFLFVSSVEQLELLLNLTKGETHG